MVVTHLRRSCPGDLMPARIPSLVLRVVKTTEVAEGTLMAAVFFPLLCRHPYLLRSSVGLVLRPVKVETWSGQSQVVLLRGYADQHRRFSLI